MSHLGLLVGDELSGGVCGREEEEEEILYPKPPMLLKLVSENNQTSCWTVWLIDMCFIWIEWSRHIKLWKKWNHSSDVWVRRRSILDKSGRKTINQIKMIFALSSQNRNMCDGKYSWQWIRSQEYFSKEIIS